jgi:signal transduction histidine kinase
MKKLIRRIAVLVCFLLVVIIQLSAQETFLIKTDTVVEFNLETKYWRVWDDSANNGTFKSVSSKSFENRFRQFDTTQQFDFSVKTFWFKLKIKNTLNKPIEIGVPWWGMNQDIFYTDSTIQWKHLKTGIGYPKPERDGYKLLNISNFILEPNQEIIIIARRYNAFRWDIPKKIQLYLMQMALQKKFDIKNQLSPTSNFEYIINSFLIGLILITCIFNLTFYKAIKEKEYLHFSLFLFFFGLNDGFGLYKNLFLNISDSYTITYFQILILAIWFFQLMLFMQTFFKTKSYLPKWNVFLKVFNYIVLASWGLQIYLIDAKISTYWFDRIIDANSILLYLFMDFLFITIFLLLIYKKVKINLRILATVPLFFLFGPIYTLIQYYYLAEKYYQVKQPDFVQLINDWNSLFTLIGVLWVILFFSWLLFKRYETVQQKLAEEIIDKEKMEREKEAEKNLLISQQNELLEIQVNERTKALQKSIENLKATQSQLVQSEKMASLGELTAGIAHEIQNPLNFVNNFSEVNEELLAEMKAAIDSGNMDEAKSLATDAIENQQKILHHGKRADSIVKGMLQHSRSTNGVKEPTDINALADEYLRLAYHGLRAKDKSFNATMKTDFDESIGNINIVPQDMGRVILNLITNAFYVVNEKKKSGIENFEPIVSVSTKKVNGSIEIKVADNGNGIPPKILDKIFQPFFTTKPTGQGTGLGLSLSYDIVKAHGGELKVETKEGEGTIFIIQLPLQ